MPPPPPILKLAPMTYIDATVAPLRKTGQIKIHGADAFEGMRKAGQLAARCLDMLTGDVQPGVPTEQHRPAGVRVRHATTARFRRR